MLEFTLLAWDSENYNIINWALTGISIRSLRAGGTHFRGRGLDSLAYWVALDVGVNPINGNLLLRGPLVDRTLTHRGPAKHLHGILHNIDFHQDGLGLPWCHP